jgi:hypothetical protein
MRYGPAGGRRDHRDGRLGRDPLVTPGLVHAVRPQADARDAIGVPGDPRAPLVRNLVHAVPRRRTQLRIRGQHRVVVAGGRPVDRGTARVHEVADPEPARQLEYPDGPLDVHPCSGDRVGRAEGELERGQVDDPGDVAVACHALQPVDVEQVAPDEVEPGELLRRQEQREPVSAPARGQDRDGHGLAHQLPDHPRADAAGAAGDQEPLVGHAVLRCRPIGDPLAALRRRDRRRRSPSRCAAR